jgi:soluble lytic murein transglycosylase-like protein
LLTSIKWPVVACVLAAVFFPNAASAHTQSPVTARTVEKKVRAYYVDMPVMIQIAKCESRFRQYDENGNALPNADGSGAVGVMQIMSSVHKGAATKLGHDIFTLDGNLAYARHLYQNEGTRPWNASKSCWGS